MEVTEDALDKNKWCHDGSLPGQWEPPAVATFDVAEITENGPNRGTDGQDHS